jgi:hypothetical protein
MALACLPLKSLALPEETAPTAGAAEESEGRCLLPDGDGVAHTGPKFHKRPDGPRKEKPDG